MENESKPIVKEDSDKKEFLSAKEFIELSCMCDN